jgi:two-component system chemotaxis response regulator CheY
MTIKGRRKKTSHSPEPTEARPHILVVDDDIGLTRLLKAILTTAHFDVDSFANGRDALEFLDHKRVEVIVMDLRMPILDGPGFFRALRSRGDRTPVLVASANGAREARRELGAEASIAKPFDPEDLIETVCGLIAKRPLNA